MVLGQPKKRVDLLRCQVPRLAGMKVDFSLAALGNCFMNARGKDQGALNFGAARDEGFENWGGLPDVDSSAPTCPFVVFFPLLGTFPFLFGFFVVIFRILGGIFLICALSVFFNHIQGTFPKGSATQSGPFHKKVGSPPKTPVFLSTNRRNSNQREPKGCLNQGGTESAHFQNPHLRNPCFRNPCLRNPAFGISVFGIPDFGIPGFGSPCLRQSPCMGFPYLRHPCFPNPCFRNP